MIFFKKMRSKSSKSSSVFNLLIIKYLILKNIGTKNKSFVPKVPTGTNGTLWNKIDN